MRRDIVVIISLLFLPLRTQVQEAGAALPEFLPVEVGEGPLLFFSHLGSYHVLDVERGGEPQLVSEDYLPGVVARVGPTKILGVGAFGAGLFLADLEFGEVQELAERPAELVSVRGSRFWFIEHLEGERDQRHELKAPGVRGEQGLAANFRPVVLLYTMEALTDAQPTLLFPDPLERIIADTVDALWVVRKRAHRELWRIPRDPEEAARKIIDFHEDWSSRSTIMDLSPDHDLLALSVRHGEGLRLYRDLVVIDLVKNAVVFEKTRLPCRVVLGSSSGIAEPLSFRWRDGRTLEVVETGSKASRFEGSAERVVFPSGETIEIPVPDEDFRLPYRRLFPGENEGRQRRGRFDMEWGKVYFAGEAELAGSVLVDGNTVGRGLTMSPDGRWVAHITPDDARALRLLDGVTETNREVVPEGCSLLMWLSAWPGPVAPVEVRAANDLEENLGCVVEVEGGLRDGRFGPVLTVDGTEAYLFGDRALSPELLEGTVSLRGMLVRKAHPDPTRAFRLTIIPFGGSYLVLEDAEFLPTAEPIDSNKGKK